MNNKKSIRKLYELIQEELYEEIYDTNDYKEISNRLNIQEELLKNSIRKDEFKIYEECVKCNTEMNWLDTEESFVKGFTMGFQFFIDTFNK